MSKGPPWYNSLLQTCLQRPSEMAAAVRENKTALLAERDPEIRYSAAKKKWRWPYCTAPFNKLLRSFRAERWPFVGAGQTGVWRVTRWSQRVPEKVSSPPQVAPTSTCYCHRSRSAEFKDWLPTRSGAFWSTLGRAGPQSGAATIETYGACPSFFALWKDADPDIPILKEAKAEYAKLR